MPPSGKLFGLASSIRWHALVDGVAIPTAVKFGLTPMIGTGIDWETVTSGVTKERVVVLFGVLTRVVAVNGQRKSVHPIEPRDFGNVVIAGEQGVWPLLHDPVTINPLGDEHAAHPFGGI